jgi:hypothetical protein
MDGKRSAPEVWRIFNKHIKEYIGESVAADVTTDGILDVLAPIVQRGSLAAWLARSSHAPSDC